MNTRHPYAVICSLGLLLLGQLTTAHGQVRTYDANFVAVGPTIDGVIGPGEWDAAAGGGGDWTLIRTPDGGDPDVENNRFRALWNQEGFFILGESDYADWGEDINDQNPAPSDFNGDFFNVFLDPNTLGEENVGQLDSDIDNYQIGFNVYPGQRSCGDDRIAGNADDCTQEPFGDVLPPDGVNVTGSTFGSLTAAHVDGLFNNDSEWEHLRGTHISYNAGENGAVIEMFIPWEEFDAPTETDKTGAETGLHHPFAPNENDVWLFNVTRQSTDADNFLPQWNWTSSQFFASHGNGAPGEGHGELRFVGGNVNLTGDYNGNGELDAGDLDVHSQYINDNNPAGDVNADGVTDTADRVAWTEQIQNSWLGDSNFDGEFSSGDFVLVFGIGKYETGDAAGYAEGDWNGDAVFDSGDFVAAFTGGGYELGPRNVTAVPEPNSRVFGFVSLIGLMVWRRRRIG